MAAAAKDKSVTDRVTLSATVQVLFVKRTTSTSTEKTTSGYRGSINLCAYNTLASACTSATYAVASWSQLAALQKGVARTLTDVGQAENAARLCRERLGLKHGQLLSLTKAVEVCDPGLGSYCCIRLLAWRNILRYCRMMGKIAFALATSCLQLNLHLVRMSMVVQCSLCVGSASMHTARSTSLLPLSCPRSCTSSV